MERVVIPIYFDYASTLCYIAWRIVSELENEMGFESLWKGVPISLRDFKTRAGSQLGPREHQKVIMVATETGIRVTPPKIWINSDAALMGAELAREAKVFPAYHAAVFRATFEQDLDISNLEMLGDIAHRAGMDRERFLDDLRTERTASRIADNKREADDLAALGYPTFILGEFPLIGIQPKETMRLIIARYMRQREENPGN
ncbi:MAG TPA: DsbA family protein [Candidatus Binataceae bacterium]|nr:DsbA family protein [Candidatus Binataceae bacterium]